MYLRGVNRLVGMVDKRLERGIWKTSSGYRVIIRVGDKLERKRFPPTSTVEALRNSRADHIRLRRPTRASRRSASTICATRF